MPVILANFVSLSSESEFTSLIQPFLDLEPAAKAVMTLPWNRLPFESSFGIDALMSKKGNMGSVYGMCTKQIEIDTFVRVAQSLGDLFEQSPATRRSIFALEWYGSDIVRQLPSVATAYAWRDSKAYMLINPSWVPEDPTSKDAATSWARQSRTALARTSGFDAATDHQGQHKVFLSYAHGDESPEQIFGANLPRLREVKTRWDPGNVFRWGPAVFD